MKHAILIISAALSLTLARCTSGQDDVDQSSFDLGYVRAYGEMAAKVRSVVDSIGASQDQIVRDLYTAKTETDFRDLAYRNGAAGGGILVSGTVAEFIVIKLTKYTEQKCTD